MNPSRVAQELTWIAKNAAIGTRYDGDGMTNAIVWIMVGMVAYLFYDHMVHSTTPESVPCDECNAGIGEPCRPYCIGLDSEDL